mgnify:CR=1 FL=1
MSSRSKATDPTTTDHDARRDAGGDRSEELAALMRERILVMDGAMGTMIQRQGLSEEDFRGERFADWSSDLKGNNDLLCLTRPDIISGLHDRYYAAGADISETNTFSGTTIAQADYGMESIIHELNAQGARLAREAAQLAERQDAPRAPPVLSIFAPRLRPATVLGTQRTQTAPDISIDDESSGRLSSSDIDDLLLDAE